MSKRPVDLPISTSPGYRSNPLSYAEKHSQAKLKLYSFSQQNENQNENL